MYFCKIPETCNEFYVITGFARNQTTNPEYWSNFTVKKAALIFIRIKYTGKWELVSFNDGTPNGCSKPLYIGMPKVCNGNQPPNFETTQCMDQNYYNGLLVNSGGNNNNGDQGPNDNDPEPDHYYGRTALIEVTKLQQNNKRYLFFASAPTIFAVAEINKDEIKLVDCQSSNIGYPFGTESYGVRDEMELYEDDEQITVAFPYSGREISSPNATPPIYSSMSGIKFVVFDKPKTINSSLSFFNSYSKVINTYIGTNDRLPLVKGLEFSQNGNYLYYSGIILKRNYVSNKVYNFEISHEFQLGYLEKDNQGIYNNPTVISSNNNWVSPILNGINNPIDILPTTFLNTCALNNSLNAENSLQTSYSHIEKTKDGALIFSNKDNLFGLANSNNPNSNSINPIVNVSDFNRLSANLKDKMADDGFKDVADPFFPFTPFTYLLPDQIDGEDYTNWIKPIPNIYPEKITLFPNSIGVLDYTNISHEISFCTGHLNNPFQYDCMPASFIANTLIQQPLIGGGGGWYYPVWSQIPSLGYATPIVKAKVKHLSTPSNYCPGFEEIDIIDLRHLLYKDFDVNILSIDDPLSIFANPGVKVTISNAYNVYQIPNDLKPCTERTINIYVYNQSNQTRGALVASETYSATIPLKEFNFYNLSVGQFYEIEQINCYQNCYGNNIPDCSYYSKIISF